MLQARGYSGYTRDFRRSNKINPLIETDLGVAPKYDHVSFCFCLYFFTLNLTSYLYRENYWLSTLSILNDDIIICNFYPYVKRREHPLTFKGGFTDPGVITRRSST